MRFLVYTNDIDRPHPAKDPELTAMQKIADWIEKSNRDSLLSLEELSDRIGICRR